MKKLFFLIVAAGFLFYTSCTKMTETVPQGNSVLKSGHKMLNFRAHLTGDQEVPAVQTLATGEAIFQVNADMTEMSYKLIVANLEDVFMAHIHLGAVGENGGIVVWLYPSSGSPSLIPGTTNGILAQGVITADNLTGTLAGQPLSALIEQMESGNSYVNAHTNAHHPGEIRGQISGN